MADYRETNSKIAFGILKCCSVSGGYFGNVQITKNVADTQLKFLSSPVSNNVQFTCFAPDKMEITAIKNSVVKVNQHRSEYTAYIEEEAQLRKLGIKNV